MSIWTSLETYSRANTVFFAVKLEEIFVQYNFVASKCLKMAVLCFILAVDFDFGSY